MKRVRTIAGGILCLGFLWTGTAFAKFTPSPQQLCNFNRITAWKIYRSCIDNLLANGAKGLTFDTFKTSWACRHTYFKKWTAYQTKTSLAGSSCTAGVGNRFTVTDSGATVTDALTGLVWEVKSNTGVHNGTDTYTWSSSSTAEDGTLFTTFLNTDLNASGFAGSNGWRVPTLAELMTILQDFPCTHAGGSPTCICTGPCLAFTDGNTQSGAYWTATSALPDPTYAISVDFGTGAAGDNAKTGSIPVRAVRGGF